MRRTDRNAKEGIPMKHYGATELIHIGQAVIVLGGKVQYFVKTV